MKVLVTLDLVGLNGQTLRCRDGGDFVIGKAQKLSDGKDVSIFACGHMVWKAIEAGKILEEKVYQ
jgi:transketolase C-terminal domain/subunit